MIAYSPDVPCLSGYNYIIYNKIMSNKPQHHRRRGPTASGRPPRHRTREKISAARSYPPIHARSIAVWTSAPQNHRRRTPAVPHHLIDIKDPNEDYTVADYQRDAIAAINDIIARGKFPILVGGTGLYVQAVIENLDIPTKVARSLTARANRKRYRARRTRGGVRKDWWRSIPKRHISLIPKILAAWCARSRSRSRPANRSPRSEKSGAAL